MTNETIADIAREMFTSRERIYNALTPYQVVKVSRKVAKILDQYAFRVLAAHNREMEDKNAAHQQRRKNYHDQLADKDAVITRLKVALWTICTADKTAEELREIAIDACNGKESAQ